MCVGTRIGMRSGLAVEGGMEGRRGEGGREGSK